MTLAQQAGYLSIGEDIHACRMGFGTARLAAGEQAWGRRDDEPALVRLLKMAFDYGINFFDTAEAYGPLICEELIGRAFPSNRHDMFVATKVGLYRNGTDPNDFRMDASRAYIMRAIDGSLYRLKRDHVDLYQLHRVDPQTPIETSMEAFAELQACGKVRNIGLSEVGIAEIERASKVVRIAAVQNMYNVLDRQHEEVLTYCEVHGIAFIPWSPIAKGRLATADGLIGRMALKYGVSTAQICLAWLLRRSPNIILIPGHSCDAYLDENVRAAAIVLTDEDFAILDSAHQDPELQKFRHIALPVG